MLSSEVKQKRQALGLTRQELADAIGFPEETIAQWESEKLSAEDSDVIEVALAFLELIRPRRDASQ